MKSQHRRLDKKSGSWLTIKKNVYDLRVMWVHCELNLRTILLSNTFLCVQNLMLISPRLNSGKLLYFWNLDLGQNKNVYCLCKRKSSI